MHIHFKELGLTKYSRDEIYSMVDVIGEQVIQFNTCIQGSLSCPRTAFCWDCNTSCALRSLYSGGTLNLMSTNRGPRPDWPSCAIMKKDHAARRCVISSKYHYRASHLLVYWVLMTWISSVPKSAGLCLGWWELCRSGWAAGQDGGTQKTKSTQPRSTSTWDAPYSETISVFSCVWRHHRTVHGVLASERRGANLLLHAEDVGWSQPSSKEEEKGFWKEILTWDKTYT